MAKNKIHIFSDGGLHTALLVVLLLTALGSIVDAVFFTPEGKTPVMWRLDPVVIEGQAKPAR
jgi:hypothetical protein